MINKHTAIGRRMLREMRRGQQLGRPRTTATAPAKPRVLYEGFTVYDLLRGEPLDFSGFAELGRRAAEKLMEQILQTIERQLLLYGESMLVIGGATVQPTASFGPFTRYEVPHEKVQREVDRVVDEGTPIDAARGPSVLQEALASIDLVRDYERRTIEHHNALAEIGRRYSKPPLSRRAGPGPWDEPRFEPWPP